MPTETTPWEADLVDEDPCSIGSFTTVFDVVNRKVTKLTYYKRFEVFIVSQKEEFETGLQIFQIKEGVNSGKYDLFNGTISYKSTVYKNSAQVSDACEKDYNLLIVNERTDSYKLDNNRNLYFSGWVQTSYSSSGQSSRLGQQSFSGREQTWTLTRDEGDLDLENNFWVIQPTRVETDISPPGSIVIKPLVEEIVNFSEYSLSGLSPLEPKPINGPFCYSVEQLNVIGDRYLRENYGLSKGIVLTVPIRNNLSVNDSVFFTDRKGETNKYLVWGIEINLTLKIATKTLFLLRFLDA